MIRAVLDVNVLVSAFPAPEGTPAMLLDAWGRGQFVMVISETMLGSLSRAWRKPYFRARYTEGEGRQALALLHSYADVVEPAPDIRGVADDLEDDLVLATAVAGNVSHLVTGDRRLLERDGYRGLILMTPADVRLVLEGPEPAESR